MKYINVIKDSIYKQIKFDKDIIKKKIINY